MGIVTIGKTKPENAGSEGKVLGEMTFSTSYSTGGDSFDPAKLGLSNVTRLNFATQDGLLFQPDYSNNKIKVYASSGGGGAPVFSGSQLAYDYVALYHDAAASSYPFISLMLNTESVDRIFLACFTGNSSRVLSTDALNKKFFINDYGLSLFTLNVIHNGGAFGLPQVYARPTNSRTNEAILVANVGSTIVYEDTGANDSFIIWPDNNASQFSVPIYFDEDAPVVNERMLINRSGGLPMYVSGIKGSYLLLKHSGAAAVDGVTVHVNIPSPSSQRLEFVSPTLANGIWQTENSDCFSSLLNMVPFQVYIDEDAINFEERLQVNLTAFFTDDLYVRVWDRYVKIKNSATAAADGVPATLNLLNNHISYVSPTVANSLTTLPTGVAPMWTTPAGTIAGGGGSISEVSNGTDLSPYGAIPFEAYGY